MKGIGSILHALTASAVLLGCAPPPPPLTPEYIASDGTPFKQTFQYADWQQNAALGAAVVLEAVKASGAYDLRCPAADVKPRKVTSSKQYVADGCGKRATYSLADEWLQGRKVYRLLLMGRFPIEPPP